MSGRAFPVILVAPSGTGKTTLAKRLVKEVPNLKYSISATTRAPRKGEKNGVDYYFLDEVTFMKWIKENKLYEWTKAYENYYGTPKEPFLRYLSQGHKVLMDLDVQGAKNIKSLHPESITIFILPPSNRELKNRLTKREEDSQKIEERLKHVNKELSHSKEFDYIVVNKSIDKTVHKLKAIIEAEECRVKNER